MIDYDNKRLLIISNNPLSNTNANGKTILSYFDSVPRNQVRQLYFRDERPTVDGYEYFRISDIDIIRGLIAHDKRGGIVSPSFESRNHNRASTGTSIPVKINNTTRLLREGLWWKKWKSKKLVKWLDEFKPTTVFFVAGDSGFAYDICMYIVNRYKSRLSVYITDDYIIPRKQESLILKARRNLIKSKMMRSVKKADSFFTISSVMRTEYKRIFGIDSRIVVNMPDRIRQSNNLNNNNNEYVLLYAGALNYGRDETIHLIATAIDRYNNVFNEKKAILRVYTNKLPAPEILNTICVVGASEYGGSLNRDELNTMLNQADVLVFVESFEEEQIEKTRLSLSTKVPEYLSAGKPVFAVGPSNIGSMEYLQEAAACCNKKEEIYNSLTNLLNDESTRLELAERAYKKYEMNHDKAVIQEPFLYEVFGVRKG